jgi:hypothetical protein
MVFLAENWLYILALILFVAMHLFGWGCGRSHAFHRQRHECRPKDAGNAGHGHMGQKTKIVKVGSISAAK